MVHKDLEVIKEKLANCGVPVGYTSSHDSSLEILIETEEQERFTEGWAKREFMKYDGWSRISLDTPNFNKFSRFLSGVTLLNTEFVQTEYSINKVSFWLSPIGPHVSNPYN